MSDTPTEPTIPTPARVIELWDGKVDGGHNAHCWMHHPACALRRLHGEMSIDLERQQHEIDRLRQGLWDVYAILGGDTDGDPTPAALAGDIVDLVLEEARQHRDDYASALDVAYPLAASKRTQHSGRVARRNAPLPYAGSDPMGETR